MNAFLLSEIQISELFERYKMYKDNTLIYSLICFRKGFYSVTSCGSSRYWPLRPVEFPSFGETCGLRLLPLFMY